MRTGVRWVGVLFMDDDVRQLEQARERPLVRLGGMFVGVLSVLGTLWATWQDLVLRATTLVLLGALAVFLLERGARKARDGKRSGDRRYQAAAVHGRRAASVVTVGVVALALGWTWRIHDAPDMTIESLRLGQMPDGGGSVLVTLDGGERSDLVTRMTLMTAFAQISACGGGEVERITVSPQVALSASDGGVLRISSEQESSLQPGATVRVEGGNESHHCGDTSWLHLRPQQPVPAAQLGQILVEVPADFEIASAVLTQPGGESRPIQNLLDEGTFSDEPEYEDSLRKILPGTTHGIMQWPWELDRSAIEAAGWRAALLVAVTSEDEECVLAGIDLLSDDPRLLDAGQTAAVADSAGTWAHLPDGCHDHGG